MCKVVAVIAVCSIWMLSLDSVRGELPVLEPFVVSLKDELKAEIGGSSVVVSVRLLGKEGWPWAVRQTSSAIHFILVW